MTNQLVRTREAGKTVRILRQGKPVGQLTAISTTRKPIEIALLVSVTEGMQPQDDGAGNFMRKMRDGERY
ncbi:type II toxin-antitoxin system prevent-host-death family antitoxin [Pararhizobium sp. LjRoot255]|uniref:type II toxin-antitoxin system prevent-host-death family antitoxin n=1 Tax=Pararhizobium sp. LjRoot255 TaxID=3342298 RepID=UPI003ECF1C06